MKAQAVKFFRPMIIMIVIGDKQSWQIPVPAAAVIQERLALFGIIERKACVGCILTIIVKV